MVKETRANSSSGQVEPVISIEDDALVVTKFRKTPPSHYVSRKENFQITERYC